MTNSSKPSILFLALTLLATAVYAGETSPRGVVSKWIELKNQRKHDEAKALTTEHSILSGELVMGVKVDRSLSSKRAAAVVTTPLRGSGEKVLLFWLVKDDDVWRINKSQAIARSVADERLIGFFESGDVHWNVNGSDLVGNWEAGPGYTAAVKGGWCGSDLQIKVDGGFELLMYGPGGPADEFKGTWRLTGDKIEMTQGDRKFVSQVTWLGKDTFTLAPVGGKGGSKYEPKEVYDEE